MAEPGTETVALRVGDNGRGIAAEALTHIFDLFSEARPSEAAGVGIGLSVVREIVLLHNGRIEARGAGPGQGSEFIVTLPLALPPVELLAGERSVVDLSSYRVASVARRASATFLCADSDR